MKQACQKCASYEPLPTPAPAPTLPQPALMPTHPYPPKMEPGIIDPENTLYANAQAFDMEKLNQAVLGYRPNPISTAAYRPFTGTGYYSGYPNQVPMYFPMIYQQQPASYGLQSYNIPYFGQQYFGHQRTARNMDIRGQLEALTSRMSGRVKNITCVMQELGYLDEKLEPNFAKIKERISTLPVTEELRSDMQDGVSFCQQFSQCVPDINKDKSPISRELIRPMFFFKCYKHKKLEACIMKDVREKYVGDEDFDSEMEIRRNSKSLKIKEEDVDELASSVYEFLYGSDSNVDLDTFF